MGLTAVLASLVLCFQEAKLDDAKIKAAIEQLGADFLEEREPARKALEQAGKAAEPFLVDGTSHADHRVRRSCLELLIQLKSTAALKRATALFAGDEDPSVREAAFRLLQASGKDAEDALIGALASANSEFRRGAIQSLSDLKSEKCIKTVAELHERETDKNTRDAAWKCLMSAGKAAEPYLVKYLKDQDPNIRQAAVGGLSGSQDDRTLAAIAVLFEQETEDAPLQKAFEFLQRAGPKAEATFLAGLKCPRPPTKLKSIQGLRQIKSEKALEAVAEIFMAECPPDVRGAAMEFLKAQGLRAETALIKGLDIADPGIRLASIQTLGEIGSEKALERIGRLFREEKNKEIHRQCFDFLKRLGLKAEVELLGALSDEDKEIRREAVFALGDAQSERAIPRLIDFMTELDPVMKEASEVALASIGPKAIEEVAKAVASGRVRKTVAEGIELQYARSEVERLLELQLGDDDFTGFYEGQFRDLESFGREKAVPVLIRILGDRNYVFRRAHRRTDPSNYKSSMKELAVMALGEFGGEGVLPVLRTFWNDETQMRLSKRVREETMVALHRQGDRKPLEDYLRDTRQNADKLLKSETAEFKEEGCDQLFSLGLLHTRLRQYPEATQVYHELIAAVEKFKLDKARQRNISTTYYNLACLCALAGERAKGVDWLEKAVKAGFNDRAWIQKDRDLDGIRQEPGYKKLISDDKLFEKKPDDFGPADK